MIESHADARLILEMSGSSGFGRTSGSGQTPSPILSQIPTRIPSSIPDRARRFAWMVPLIAIGLAGLAAQRFAPTDTSPAFTERVPGDGGLTSTSTGRR